MVDLSAHSIGFHAPATAKAAVKAQPSFAKGFLIGVPLSLALWGAIVWAIVSVL